MEKIKKVIAFPFLVLLLILVWLLITLMILMDQELPWESQT